MPKINNKKVLFIIVVYNKWNVTQGCFPSVCVTLVAFMKLPNSRDPTVFNTRNLSDTNGWKQIYFHLFLFTLD